MSSGLWLIFLCLYARGSPGFIDAVINTGILAQEVVYREAQNQSSGPLEGLFVCGLCQLVGLSQPERTVVGIPCEVVESYD